MAAVLVPGSLPKLAASGVDAQGVALKVSDLVEANGKMKCTFSDGGKENMAGLITSQVARQLGATLKNNDIVRVTEGNLTTGANDRQVLIVAAMEVVAAGAAGDVAAMAVDAAPIAAAPASPAAPGTETKTPAAAALKTAGGAGAPRSGPTPPSSGPAAAGGLKSASKRPTVPLSSLNPYMHGWAVRAKVLSKGPKRSFSKAGAPSSVFSAELVDAHGTAIEATFWREAADRLHEALDEGRVYVFARGSVKPANKKFSAVRNDYCLHFDAAAEVEEAAGDVDASAMTARLSFVPIDQLAAYVDKKAPVDLVAVVAAVAPLGQVKRKSDATELSRRDVTLVDQGLKTVVVTLWGPTAEGAGAALEAAAAGGAHPVVSISACRVSSYNGVSVSTLSRSLVTLEPEGVPEAAALRAWYDATGHAAAAAPVGEGMPSALKGASGRAERLDLSGLRAAAPAAAEDKPVYATIAACVAAVNPDQSLYYLACPENNRKVVEQGGAFFCEYDGRTYATATRRYIMQARLTDGSGELPVQVFNDQAEALLGCTADELAAAKEGDPARFAAVLRAATWTQWVLRVKAQAQEYNGETRQRYAVAEIRPVDFSSETRRMIDMIASGAAVAGAA